MRLPGWLAAPRSRQRFRQRRSATSGDDVPHANYRFSHPAFPNALVLHQHAVTDRDASGLWVWSAGELLASYLCAQRGEADIGLSHWDAAIELGCGAGLVSLTLARMGVGTVVATDVDEATLQLCANNAAANGVAPNLTVLQLRWGDERAAARAVEAVRRRTNLPTGGRLLVLGMAET